MIDEFIILDLWGNQRSKTICISRREENIKQCELGNHGEKRKKKKDKQKEPLSRLIHNHGSLGQPEIQDKVARCEGKKDDTKGQ